MRRITVSFLMLCILACVPVELAAQISRGPYIQMIGPSRAQIRFSTAVETRAKTVLTGGASIGREYSSGTSHMVEFNHLSLGTRFKYRIFAEDGETIGSGLFSTQSYQDSKMIRVAVLGDSGITGQSLSDIAAGVSTWRPHLFLHTGDIVYPSGSDQEYDEKFFSPFAGALRRSIFLPTIGNHDALSLSSYFGNFGLAGRYEESEPYYSLRYGPVQVISLDTNTDFSPGSTQYYWLERKLKSARHRAKWTIVFMHYPPFSSGLHGDNQLVQEELVPLLQRYASIVLSGHDHIYERSQVVSEGSRAVPYLVTGGGGAELYPVNPQPYSVVALSKHHYLRFSIINSPKRKRFRVRAIAEDGEVLDNFLVR